MAAGPRLKNIFNRSFWVVAALAALLTRQWPATFDDLARGVPEYADESRDLETRKKMFERDKDELRSLGVPIEVASMDAYFDDEPGYRIRRSEFELPRAHPTSFFSVSVNRAGVAIVTDSVIGGAPTQTVVPPNRVASIPV